MENIKEIYNYCLEDKIEIEDCEQRRIYINYEIDDDIIYDVVHKILRYNRLDMGIPVKDREPIIIYMNTPGGSLSSGYGLIDAISTSETPIYTVNLALCASMGFLIFISGHKRYAMEHSEFLMHDGSTYGYDSTAKMKDRMEFETNQLEKMNKNYIISHTNIDAELYDKQYRKEWYFLPDEGKEIGAVDYIVGKDCKIGDIL